MKQRKDIGEIYKNLFSGEETIPDTNLWEMVELKTEKIKFYRFGLSHFNIYYLSTIVLFSLLSIYSFVEVTTFIKNHPEAKSSSLVQLSNSEEEAQDSIVSSNNSTISNTNQNLNREKTGPTEKIIVNKDLKGKRTIDTVLKKNEVNNSNKPLFSTIKTDSIKNYHKANSSSQTVIKKEPKRRVVYIEQPDTIIVIDTLKGKEARKKRAK